MTFRIEDHAFIGDCPTTAMVGRGRSIDRSCLPPACLAAPLGGPQDGRWRSDPVSVVTATRSGNGPG